MVLAIILYILGPHAWLLLLRHTQLQSLFEMAVHMETFNRQLPATYFFIMQCFD